MQANFQGEAEGRAGGLEVGGLDVAQMFVKGDPVAAFPRSVFSVPQSNNMYC